MGTLILDSDEQKYSAKQIEKAIQNLRKSWRMKAWDKEDDMAHVHLGKI